MEWLGVQWFRGEGVGNLLRMLGATELDAADAGKVVEALLKVEYERDWASKMYLV